MRIARLGHVVFALTMIGLGLMGLATHAFTPIWTGVPKGLPARAALAYLCAMVSLLTGAGLLWRPTASAAARVLLASLLAWLVLLRLPRIFVAPAATDTWWACGETAVMASAAWCLAVRFARDRHANLSLIDGEPGLRLARLFYGLGLIPFGVAHFTYFSRTVSMVPRWLPWHAAWAVLFGGTFIAAGVALVIGMTARLAAIFAALQLGLFTVLVWGPVVAAGPNLSDRNEAIVSWVLTAAAWVVADSFHVQPEVSP